MPYITQSERNVLKQRGFPETPGALNYELTMLCLNFLRERGESYSTINVIVGALECCKLEFYRRAAAPYEDVKIASNGDVYPKLGV